MVYRIQTIHGDKVPKEMRNPYIETGYRLLYQPWSYYMKSIMHVHNETVNVWSHLIGCVLISSQLYYYYDIYKSEDSLLRWTLLGHGLCCLVTLFNSAAAHLLHSRSCYANFLVFMFDYIGVVHWGFGTSILALYGVSEESTYNKLRPYFLVVQVIWAYFNYISICMSKLWYGHDLEIKTRKRMMVIGISVQAASNVIPWFLRYIECYGSDSCDLSSLNHITIVCISFIVMALAFLFHQPERTWPGKFDICGQSHQIFHVMVIITQTLQIRCLYLDYRANVNAHCKPNFYELLGYIAALYFSCLATLIYLITHIKKKTAVVDNNNKCK